MNKLTYAFSLDLKDIRTIDKGRQAMYIAIGRQGDPNHHPKNRAVPGITWTLVVVKWVWSLGSLATPCHQTAGIEARKLNVISTSRACHTCKMICLTKWNQEQ